MAYPPQQPSFDPERQPPSGLPPGLPPGPPSVPPQGPSYQPGGYPPQPPPYGQQPGYGGYPLPPRRRPKAGMVFGILIGSMVLIVVVGLLIGQADDGPSASDSPQEVVSQYFDVFIDVLNSSDATDPQAIAERLAPYLCADLREEMSEVIEEMGDPDEMTAMYSDEELEAMDGMQFDVEYVITGSAVFGDTAIVEVDFTTVITTEEYGTQSEDSSESVDLVRESGTWKICDDTSGEFF